MFSLYEEEIFGVVAEDQNCSETPCDGWDDLLWQESDKEENRKDSKDDIGTFKNYIDP